MNYLTLSCSFEYQNVQYKAMGQIRKHTDEYKITVGYYGDEFPCIILEYKPKEDLFIVSKLRAQPWGAYKNDDRVICIQPPLSERGALDMLVLLSLKIMEHFCSNKPKVQIKDAAMKDEYPLSWLKFFNRKDNNSELTTYSKYGFRLRDEENFNYDIYFNNIDRILNKPLFKLYSVNERKKLGKEIMEFNQKLKSKKIKQVVYNDNTKLIDLLKYIFETRRFNDYEKVLDILEAVPYEIRGYWYLDWQYYYDKVSKNIKNFDFKTS